MDNYGNTCTVNVGDIVDSRFLQLAQWCLMVHVLSPSSLVIWCFIPVTSRYYIGDKPNSSQTLPSSCKRYSPPETADQFFFTGNPWFFHLKPMAFDGFCTSADQFPSTPQTSRDQRPRRIPFCVTHWGWLMVAGVTWRPSWLISLRTGIYVFLYILYITHTHTHIYIIIIIYRYMMIYV